ncbi:hypothetical protein ABQD95_19125 [Enterococcus avium]|uniref:hypothetical protein n=1 Tax=Enterococcus avium TaxID=33945 RepID=UPI00288C8E91|nr:hypothetical protein [Enterococcus avium]MDT2390965.1 hypothetical protein [Enterococcus avium]
MTDKNYIDLEGMQNRADAEFQAKVDKSKEVFEKKQEQSRKEQEAVQALWNKSLQIERDEAEKKRAAEIEVEKAKAIAEVEAKYESQGIKSEETVKKEVAFKSMLSNMRGMKD